MSHVNNFALFLTVANGRNLSDEDLEAGLPPNLLEINAGLSELQSHHAFARCDQHAGGYKVFEALCFLLAANYVSLEDVAGEIAACEWEDPDGVALIYCGQGDMQFSFYTLDELKRIAAAAESPAAA